MARSGDRARARLGRSRCLAAARQPPEPCGRRSARDGGIAYTAGAIVYARRRPDPAPAVFGYHELFHALTIVAVACQYVAIAFFVIRAG